MRKWGIKGVKIDFMDHENLYGTMWYRRILDCWQDRRTILRVASIT